MEPLVVWRRRTLTFFIDVIVFDVCISNRLQTRRSEDFWCVYDTDLRIRLVQTNTSAMYVLKLTSLPLLRYVCATQKGVSTSSIEFTPATKQSGLVPFGSFPNAVPLYHITHNKTSGLGRIVFRGLNYVVSVTCRAVPTV